jgi:uncharacterized Zn finger protein
MDALRKKGVDIQPIKIEGLKIAKTFWGKAWCEHLEQFSDFANRLPRGRTYVRNGSVCHLAIEKGQVEAKVSGSELYDVKILIDTLPAKQWKSLKAQCAGQVGSMLELLQGNLSSRVMEVVTERDQGLFPRPKEIHLGCSCPDYATMCKHVAAVLYGVGARLDTKPELLFLLRGVDHAELVGEEAAAAVVKAPAKKGRVLAQDSLADVFGIELGEEPAPADVAPAKRPRATRKPKVDAPAPKAVRKTKKKAAKKKPKAAKAVRKGAKAKPANP